MTPDYNLLLEEHIRSQGKIAKDRNGLSPEDVLEMQALMDKINEINLESVVQQRLDALSPVEKLIQGLKENKEVERVLGKPKGKPRVHPRTKRQQRRKRDRKYYKEILKPRRRKELAEELTTPEGWWKYLGKGWEKRDVKVELTYDEFVKEIYSVSVARGIVPLIFRYDPDKPIALDNIVVRSNGISRDVVFDGKEYTLRLLGYIV